VDTPRNTVAIAHSGSRPGFRMAFPQKGRTWVVRMALPRTTAPLVFQEKALIALAGGACFCVAGVVQGLGREQIDSLLGVATPCTMIWGAKDHSHKYTDPMSLHELVPKAEIVHFEDCGHFPDIEQPERFAALIAERVARYA